MKRIKVFYLDDETELCDNFKEFHDSAQVEVHVFSDIAQFKSAIESEKADVIFLDYRLPGITGDELAVELNLSEPVYLVTGEVSVKPQFIFKDILNKPTDPSQVDAILALYLKGA